MVSASGMYIYCGRGSRRWCWDRHEWLKTAEVEFMDWLDFGLGNNQWRNLVWLSIEVPHG